MRKSYKLAARVLAKVIEAEIPNWHLQLGDGDKKEIILIQEQRQMKEKRKMETCIWRKGGGVEKRGKAGTRSRMQMGKLCSSALTNWVKLSVQVKFTLACCRLAAALEERFPSQFEYIW